MGMWAEHITRRIMVNGTRRFSSGAHKPEDAGGRLLTKWSGDLVKVSGTDGVGRVYRLTDLRGGDLCPPVDGCLLVVTMMMMNMKQMNVIAKVIR